MIIVLGVVAQCTAFAGDVFEARLPRDVHASDWSLQQVSIVFGERGYASMCGKPGSLFGRWLFDNPQSGQVIVLDQAQAANDKFNGNHQLACGQTQGGRYYYRYSNDCGQLTLELIDDPCLSRSQLLRNVVLHRRACSHNEWSHGHCESKAGSMLYSLDSAGVQSVAGVPAYTTITMGQCGNFIEYHRNVTVFGTVVAKDDAAVFSDVASDPKGDSCAVGVSGAVKLLHWEVLLHSDQSNEDSFDSSSSSASSTSKYHSSSYKVKHTCDVKDSKLVHDSCKIRQWRLQVSFHRLLICSGRGSLS